MIFVVVGGGRAAKKKVKSKKQSYIFLVCKLRLYFNFRKNNVLLLLFQQEVNKSRQDRKVHPFFLKKQ